MQHPESLFAETEYIRAQCGRPSVSVQPKYLLKRSPWLLMHYHPSEICFETRRRGQGLSYPNQFPFDFIVAPIARSSSTLGYGPAAPFMPEGPYNPQASITVGALT